MLRPRLPLAAAVGPDSDYYYCWFGPDPDPDADPDPDPGWRLAVQKVACKWIHVGFVSSKKILPVVQRLFHLHKRIWIRILLRLRPNDEASKRIEHAADEIFSSEEQLLGSTY